MLLLSLPSSQHTPKKITTYQNVSVIIDTTQSDMEKMRQTQLAQAVYIRKMQALPGKVKLQRFLLI